LSPPNLILAAGTTGDNGLPVSAIRAGRYAVFNVDNDRKGAVAETAVALEAMKLGIGVYRPLADERYDLIFDLSPQLVRVQVKWASRCADVIVARLYSARRSRVAPTFL
jgi:PD-(D/E)XK endonuclease